MLLYPYRDKYRHYPWTGTVRSHMRTDGTHHGENTPSSKLASVEQKLSMDQGIAQTVKLRKARQDEKVKASICSPVFCILRQGRSVLLPV